MAGPEDTADDRAGVPGLSSSGMPFRPPPAFGPSSFGPPPTPPSFGSPSVPPPPPTPPALMTPPPPGPGLGLGREAPPPFAGGDFFTGYGSGAAIASRPTPRRRRLKAGLVAAGAAGLVATSLVVVLGNGPDAQAAVLNAANATLAGKTAQLTLNMTMSVGGESVTASGTGSADFSQNAMALNMSMSGVGQQLALQEIMVGGTLYEGIPGISIVEPGKSWVSADISQFAHNAASGTGGALGAGEDPAATLHMLAQQGNTVTSLGASTVNGDAVQGYAVTIDKATIEKDLSQASIPSSIRQAIDSFAISGFHIRVYIDDQGQLRREAVDMALTVASQSVSANATVDFSDYGTLVNIGAPPADQVVSLQQFLQDAAAVEGGSGSR